MSDRIIHGDEKLAEQIRQYLDDNKKPLPENLQKKLDSLKEKVNAAIAKGSKMQWSEELPIDLWILHGEDAVESFIEYMEQYIEINRLMADEDLGFEDAWGRVFGETE